MPQVGIDIVGIVSMDSIAIGSAICKLRKDKKYTQKQLAQELCVSDKTVSKWERGIGVPDVSLLAKLSIILDTDIESLLDGNIMHNSKMWRGVISCFNNIGEFDIQIHDKPMLDYIISNFMLVGIREVLITLENHSDIHSNQCREIIKNYKENYDVDISVIDKNDIGAIAEYITGYSVMYIYDKMFIYGPDLTKYYQRAMRREESIVVPFLATAKTAIGIDRIIDEKQLLVCSVVPVIFVSNNAVNRESLADIISNSFSVNDFIQSGCLIYGEQMGRGMFHLNMSDGKNCEIASNYISIVQETQGEKVCDLREIYQKRFSSSKK